MHDFFTEYAFWIELFSTLMGILGVWLTIRQNIWCFPTGIVNVVLYAWIYFNSQIYANSLLQIVYMMVLIYGWYNWQRGKNQADDLPVTKASRSLLLGAAFIFTAMFASVYFILISYTKTDVPVPDAFIFSLGIIAQYFVARKKIENWHLWIIVNIVSVVLNFYKELYFMTGFYVLLIIMAVIGYKEWKKEIVK